MPSSARPAESLAAKVEREHGPFDPLYLQALAAVPRGRFVREIDRSQALVDTPLPLDESGLATISAPHAYLLSFRLVDLQSGDRLIELGSGAGYGSALASFIVGPRGRVTTFEIDETLAARARDLLRDVPNVDVVHLDAMQSVSRWGDATKVIVTFAMLAIPDAWIEALPEGGVLVVPLGPPETNQRLIRIQRTNCMIRTSDHGAVRYVANRSPNR